MANKDRASLKAGYQAVTDRTPPYDSEPLIQKQDQQTTIGDDFMDSALVKLPNIGSINSPSAAFNVDFDFDTGRDRYDIDTTGSADDTFTITLAGLSDNQTGILNITKKSQDVFSFSNGSPYPVNSGQIGLNSLIYFVRVVNGVYLASSTLNAIGEQTDWATLPVSSGVSVINGRDVQYRISIDGSLQLRGAIQYISGSTSVEVLPPGSIPPDYTYSDGFSRTIANQWGLDFIIRDDGALDSFRQETLYAFANVDIYIAKS